MKLSHQIKKQISDALAADFKLKEKTFGSQNKYAISIGINGATVSNETKIKLMLTDNNGQQKDRLQDAKRKALAEPAEYAEVVTVTKTSKQKSLDMI